MLCVEGATMATNLQIDNELITKAVKLGGHSTKKDAVTQALTEDIRHLEQERMLSLFGTAEFDPRYDFKQQRSRG